MGLKVCGIFLLGCIPVALFIAALATERWVIISNHLENGTVELVARLFEIEICVISTVAGENCTSFREDQVPGFPNGVSLKNWTLARCLLLTSIVCGICGPFVLCRHLCENKKWLIPYCAALWTLACLCSLIHIGLMLRNTVANGKEIEHSQGNVKQTRPLSLLLVGFGTLLSLGTAIVIGCCFPKPTNRQKVTWEPIHNQPV
ncbi:uncharacterized protein LOC127860922 [Dreissena polymorpha]|uniref:uncharacterized protein LOC127860922 n=1 Tax=Dreissena polymorpha TaxID=45954 RepID=UPI002264351B|nr:uncharacterized protein LOC127860922 [Dreissena polymorpha]